MKHKNLSPLFLVLLLVASQTFAQRYNFYNYPVTKGLGAAGVNHIFQDSRGYIWFATQGGGASRFNGKEFKNFTKAEGLIDNDVTYITEDRNGHIWIATAKGVSEFTGNRFINYSKAEGLTDHIVYCIYPDADKMWFATEDAGVKTLNGNQFKTLPGIPKGEVYTIQKDQQGNFYFGVANGIIKYNGRATRVVGTSLNLNQSYFCSMLDERGNIWLGSMSGEVVVIHPTDTIEKLELPEALRNDFIGGMAQDKNGYLWLATDHGLLKYNGSEFKLFTEHEGLSVNTVQAVMADYENNIWAGTLTGGADMLTSEAFVQYTEKDGLSAANVTAVCANNGSHQFWIGTGSGLYLFDTQSKPLFKKISGVHGLDNISITSLAMDANNHLWVSAQEGVLLLETTGKIINLLKAYKTISGQRVVSPVQIIHDHRGDTWVATYGSGVFCIHNGIEKNYTLENGFPTNKVLSVFEDAEHNIWFGTLDKGVVKYDGNSFTPITPIQETVWCITQDAKGNLFFGTNESGVLRYDGKTINRYTTADGLSSNNISSLQWNESESCLWVGSEQGLDRLKWSTSNKVIKHHYYTEQDGFKPSVINQNGISPRARNEMILATSNGLWSYNNQSNLKKSMTPKILLTDIRLFYQKTDWHTLTDSVHSISGLPALLELKHNKNYLTFDIQALTTGQVLYTSILEGQDENWSSPTPNHEITYQNIQPGHYTFKAKAINHEGYPSEVVSFSFTIHPPWWRTIWFYAGLVIILVLGLMFLIRRRERLLREQNLQLEATVKQRTQTIEEQKHTLEKMLSEKEVLLKEIHHRVKNNLQTISSMLMLQGEVLKDEQAQKAIMESQSRVRSIALVHQKLYQTEGLEKVELSGFIKDLTEQVTSLYPVLSKNISIVLNIPHTNILIDKAIPLGLISNELLTNSLKYAFVKSKTGEIRIELTELPNVSVSNSLSKKVQLIYRDSGEGFNFEEKMEAGGTLGVDLITLLSEQIGASISYSSISGSEFIFTFSINL